MEEDYAGIISELRSVQWILRLQACEKVTKMKVAPPEIIQILIELSNNSNKNLAEAAKNALQVHNSEIEKFNKLLITTTNNIEGYRIVEYLGIISAEVVLGTGWLTELEGGIADIFGGQSSKFQNKLSSAKEIVLRNLSIEAVKINANAIIAIDIDYSVLERNMLMVMVNGTAVKTEILKLPNQAQQPT
jgi:uncharacterized protein YbjQ (UPF0145 family)